MIEPPWTEPPPGGSTRASGASRVLLRAESIRWTADAGLPHQREILSGVNLEIAAGERNGLMGRSGAGKTTLASILAGLLEPSSGRIFDVGHLRPPGRSPDSGSIGLVFQEPENGFFEETVLADVRFGPANLGLRQSDSLRRAEEALRMAGLDPAIFGYRAPESLSGGEARRAAIAGILAFRPRIVIFDEPTLGLDAEGVERLCSILETLHGNGSTYLIVSHDVPFLLEQCERVLILDQGLIEWDGPALELPGRLPPSWREDLSVWGGDMIAIAESLRAHGWIGEEIPPTPEALAEAWAASLSARRN
jgi:energy-coupling factor transporter ATP-binding protein EcfA2